MKNLLISNKIKTFVNCRHSNISSLTSYQPKTKEDITAKIHKYNINTVTMGFPDLYGKFIGKKYDPEYFTDKALKNGSNACNYLLSCDMGFNPIPNSKMASYEKGFGDFTMKADLSSFREITYMGDHKQLLFFADLVDQQTDKPITHAPRHLLKEAIKTLEACGYTVQIQCDINFTIFYEKYRKLSDNFSHAQTVTEHSNLYNTVYKQNLSDFFDKLNNCLKASGVNVEKMTGDKAPGQFRLSLGATDCLQFCDNITLLKLCVKKLADEADKSVSFMAKLSQDWSGNSLDLKLIIKDDQKNNILDKFSYCDTSRVSNFKNGVGENAVSGIIRHLPDFLIFYAPTVNSYKRLKEDQFDENWNKFGFMQDDCGVNIIEEKSVTKVLFTLSGSDIKSGIENKYTLNDSLAKMKDAELPINLHESLNNFKSSQYVKEVLGEELHQHLWAFYNLEYTEFMNQVDEWELNRYLFNI